MPDVFLSITPAVLRDLSLISSLKLAFSSLSSQPLLHLQLMFDLGCDRGVPPVARYRIMMQ